MSASKTNIILITGVAIGGIGIELTRQLLADPANHVIITSRSIDKGNLALKELQSLDLPGTAEFTQLDVNNEASIEAAAKDVSQRHGRLDVLVNNAAIASWPPATTEPHKMLESFRTHVIGPYLTGEHFLPLLKLSTQMPRVVNVTSGGGSIALRLKGLKGLYAPRITAYQTSKAGLNMLTADQSVFLGKEGVKVFAVCPGFTASNLGPRNNVEGGAKPTSEGAKSIFDVVVGKRDAEHGGFLHGHEAWNEVPGDGQYPW